MCGIGGFAGRFPPALLPRLGGAMQNRGPDDAGTIVLNARHAPVGLVNRRLAVQDPSPAGHQPMTTQCPACGVAAEPDEGIWLTYNGEVYNFPELRIELERAGHHFRSGTDTEVLLHLYTVEGPKMLRRLNGIFGLALYDGRPRGQRDGVRRGDLLLARDGLGVKPLYYAQTPEGVLFASEMKALLQCGDGFSRQLDAAAVSQYFTYQWVPAPRTVIEGIRKVPPGELLVTRNGRIASRETFYTLPASPHSSAASLPEQVATLRETLQAAVSRQLLSDVAVGAFLSGGLDSSAVVALARRANPTAPIPCYTMTFDDDFSSEGAVSDLPYARRVASHLGVDLVTVRADARVVDRLPDVLYALDEPTGDPAPINAFLIAEQAKRDGVTVLLSGTGGDDLFAGYPRHRGLALEPLWDALPPAARRSVSALARRRLDAGTTPGAFAGRRLLRWLATVDATGPERLASRLQTTSAGARAALLDSSIRARVPVASDYEPLLATLDSAPAHLDPLSLMLRLEQRHFLSDHNLNYLDKTTMAFGVEGRVPMLDLDVVAFAATVRSSHKLRRGQGKYILKKAMEPLLPADVVYRPKAGFGVPLRRWIARDLRAAISDVLSPDALRARRVFDEPAVSRLIERTRDGSVDGAYTVFSVFAFELWCRRFLDAAVPAIAR